MHATGPTRLPEPKEDFLAHFAALRKRGFQVGEQISIEQLHGCVVTRDEDWTAVTWTGSTDDGPDIEGVVKELSLEGKPWEWHWYSSDNHPSVPEELLRMGFTQEPPEAVLFAPTDLGIPLLAQDDIEIATISPTKIAVAAALHAEIFGAGTDAHTLELAPCLTTNPPLAEIVIASRNDIPAGTGRVEYYPHSPIAGLFGAGTVQSQRHRGIYHAVLQQRLIAAERRGYRYCVVEAMPATSAPILKSLGFALACDKIEFHSP